MASVAGSLHPRYVRCMPIRHVIFDLSEVLLTGVKETGIALGIRHQVQIPASFTGASGSLNPLMIPAAAEFFNGGCTEDRYIAEVLKLYPMFGPHQELKAHIRENFREVEGTREVVLKLRQLGYGTALLSVHGREWIEYCEARFAIHEMFDTVCYSFDHQVSKPEPQAFLRTLEQMAAKPDECLFIDDSRNNVDAANALGIGGVLFVTAEELKVELARRLPDFT
jgi:HAD superfamily hydrolase (TIGR01509 family)